MIHFKRFLWLAAWSVWVWLGFGLYRELPRNLGPVTYRLEFPSNGQVLGFLAGSHEIAVAESPFRPSNIKVFDAKSGTLTRTLTDVRPAILSSFPIPAYSRQDVRRLGVLLTVGWGGDGEGVYAADLQTGESRFICGFRGSSFRLHPFRPWAIVASNQDGPSGCRRNIMVYDFANGNVLFDSSLIWESFRGGEACFVGNTDDLVLTIHGAAGERGGFYLRYALGGPARIEKASFKIPALGADPSASDNGLVVSTDLLDDSIDVIDAPRGRIVVSDRPREQRQSRGPGSRPFVPPAILASSGKSAVGGPLPSVWNLETGKLLWQGQGERWVRGGPTDDRFGVFEDWGKPFGKPGDYMTFAWRDVHTARVLARCWAKDYRPWEWTSADGTLAVDKDGLIRKLPYRVNYPLLALCQTILALPLILLWAALRWRRKRLQAVQLSTSPSA